MSVLLENWRSPQLEAMRFGFGCGLTDLAKNDERIVALSADLAESVWFG